MRSTQERSNLLFVDFIKSLKIALRTISFGLERATAAGTISNHIFSIICLNNSHNCLFDLIGDTECLFNQDLRTRPVKQ